MKLFERTDQSFVGRWWWTVDRTLLAVSLLLMLVGVALVATASPPVARQLDLNDYHFLIRHLVFVVPSLFLMLGVSMLNPKQIRRFATMSFLATLCAMAAVLFVGYEIKGAQRWLHVGPFSIQPSEFIKPSFIVVAAWLMGLQKERERFPGNAITAGLYFLSVSLLLLQPDLGMTVVLTLVWAAQIFLAGFPFRLVLALAPAGLGGLAVAYFSFNHVKSRIDRFLNPESGDNYQIERSIEAFQNGGLFGTGPGQGEVKLSLPDSHADFIFSVAAEEFGLIFVAVLVGMYLLILARGFLRLSSSPDMFTILAAGGLLAMLGLQAFIHMGSSLHLLPAKGMTLPFISYGGSSLLSCGLAMGMLLALTRRQGRASIARGGLQSPASGAKAGAFRL